MKTRRKILILTVGAALFFTIPVRDAAAQDDHRNMPMPNQTPTPKPSPTATPKPSPSPSPHNMPVPQQTPTPNRTPTPPIVPDNSGGQQPPIPPFPPPEDWESPVHDERPYTFILADVLEFRPKGSDSDISWDVEGWHGGDFNKIWFKSEGEKSTVSKDYRADFQLLYARFIKRYYDFQIGGRVESRRFRGANIARPQFVIGIEGLRPFWFELEAAAFVDPKGNVSGRFTYSRDYLLTQRWVLQPRFETNLAIQKVERFGVGRGLNDIGLGFRLRYAIRREFAPYIGVSFERSFFGAADLIRQEGGDPGQIRFVTGVRMWR